MSFLTVTTEISQFDLITLFTAVASIVISVVAIVLSILFYKMSEKTGRENERVSTNIQNNVDKLEALFNKLYTGTFDMMKETVTDMRKHVYKQAPTKEDIKVHEEVINMTLTGLSEEIESIKSSNMDEKAIKKLVEDILHKSKTVESELDKMVIQQEVINYLKANGKATFSAIDEDFTTVGVSGDLFTAIQELIKEGKINNVIEEYKGEKAISLNKQIYLL